LDFFDTSDGSWALGMSDDTNSWISLGWTAECSADRFCAGNGFNQADLGSRSPGWHSLQITVSYLQPGAPGGMATACVDNTCSEVQFPGTIQFWTMAGVSYIDDVEIRQ